MLTSPLQKSSMSNLVSSVKIKLSVHDVVLACAQADLNLSIHGGSRALALVAQAGRCFTTGTGDSVSCCHAKGCCLMFGVA